MVLYGLYIILDLLYSICTCHMLHSVHIISYITYDIPYVIYHLSYAMDHGYMLYCAFDVTYYILYTLYII